jgi:hypothetical protein
MDKNALVNQVAFTTINLSSSALSFCFEILATAGTVRSQSRRIQERTALYLSSVDPG